ncbi:hypothetical protein [Variovorax sp. 54]|uniref:hypothetical protein n=1 Tax=Variovorax sp. 54 TaxID=2035212 RepID=UPI000C18660A|nr:hypothetical protein [Variovorax sp. 54]
MIGGINTSGSSTDEDRTDGKVIGLVERYTNKRKSVTGAAGHGRKLTGVYPDAIEFQRVYLTGEVGTT